jgi:hypothetical protein
VQPSIIERAYQMASSGQYKSLERIERALGTEGYEGAYLHLRSPALRAELNFLLRKTA